LKIRGIMEVREKCGVGMSKREMKDNACNASAKSRGKELVIQRTLRNGLPELNDFGGEESAPRQGCQSISRGLSEAITPVPNRILDVHPGGGASEHCN